jgi:hypothetical protein
VPSNVVFATIRSNYEELQMKVTARSARTETPVRSKAVRVLAVIAAMVVAMVGLGAAPAGAAETPNYTAANCGWYIQDAGLTSPFYYKISSTGLPNVTTQSASPVRVFLKVSFVHAPFDVYRTGMFYTDVVAGSWSTSWTSVTEQTSGWTSVQDSPGESGYTGAEMTTLDTFVLLQLNWYSSDGTVITDQYDQWAYAPDSPLNHNVCNAGGNLA